MDEAFSELDSLYGPPIDPWVIRDIERAIDPSPVIYLDDDTAELLLAAQAQAVARNLLSDVSPCLTILWAVDIAGRIRLGLETIVRIRPPAPPERAPRLRGLPTSEPWEALGHPNLLDLGPGRIAGELHLERTAASWRWVLDNKSGRYSVHPSRRPEHLHRAAAAFASFGIEVYVNYRG